MSTGNVTPPSRIVRLAPPRYAEAGPTLPQKLANLAEAVGAVAEAAMQGEPILVPAEVEAARLAACAACPAGLWRAEGNAGLGECAHPKCGCTAYKLKFAALACPLEEPMWGAWKPEAEA